MKEIEAIPTHDVIIYAPSNTVGILRHVRSELATAADYQDSIRCCDDCARALGLIDLLVRQIEELNDNRRGHTGEGGALRP